MTGVRGDNQGLVKRLFDAVLIYYVQSGKKGDGGAG